MPTYQSPGVYVEEVPSGLQPIEGVGTSTAAFVGLTERGDANIPRLVTNFTQFVNQFGSFMENGYLAYSAYNFFAEGGSRAYVVRVTNTGVLTSTLTLAGGDTSDSLTIDANSTGSWGDRVSIVIEDPSNEDPATHFKLVVQYLTSSTADPASEESYLTEVYDDISAASIEESVKVGTH